MEEKRKPLEHASAGGFCLSFFNLFFLRVHTLKSPPMLFLWFIIRYWIIKESNHSSYKLHRYKCYSLEKRSLEPSHTKWKFEFKHRWRLWAIFYLKFAGGLNFFFLVRCNIFWRNKIAFNALLYSFELIIRLYFIINNT